MTTSFKRLMRAGQRTFLPPIAISLAVLLAGPIFPQAVHSAQAFPFDFQGKVVYVDDGDTLIMLDANRQKHTIRLTDVDAPESPHPKYKKVGQPFSGVSGRNLETLAKGKIATAHCYEL